jgi:serine/threonine protein kinase
MASAMTDPASWPPRYSLRQICPLGSGTYGQVLLCTDHHMGKPVAIKITHKQPAYRRSALTEIDLMKAVYGNPAVVQYQDSFEIDGHVHLVMDLLCMNTYEYISSIHFRFVPLPVVRNIAETVLRALAGIHRAGYMHCDIKPENIMLLEDGHPENVCLIDFGSARRLNENKYFDIQSLWYRAPEVICGVPYTPAIDIWSVGCLLYELHTGSPLFPGEDPADTLQLMISLLGPFPERSVACYGNPAVFKPSQQSEACDQFNLNRFSALDSSRENVIQFVDLLRGLLTLDETKRLTAAEALNHSFFAGCRDSDYVEQHDRSSSSSAAAPSEDSFNYPSA